MPIQFELSLTASEKELLNNIFTCGEHELQSELSKFSRAAAEEYVRMFLGQKVFTRGSDILEYRLLLLIKTIFNNRIPDEQKICELFQMTLSESRSLIRSVMSKYQYELKEAITNSLVSTLINAQYNEEENVYIVDIKTENIVTELNRILGTMDGNLPSIIRKKGTVSTRIIKASAYDELISSNELKDKVDGIIRSVLSNANKDETGRSVVYKLNVSNGNIIHLMDEKVKTINDRLPKIDLDEEAQNIYKMTDEVFTTLNGYYLLPR